jgi:hypothetical protein
VLFRHSCGNQHTTLNCMIFPIKRFRCGTEW